MKAKKLVVGMMAIMTMALAEAKEIVVIKNGVAEAIEVTPTKVVSEGMGCLEPMKLFLGYGNPALIPHLLGSQDCALLEEGESYDVTDFDSVRGTIQFHGGNGIFFYAPPYVFGR